MVPRLWTYHTQVGSFQCLVCIFPPSLCLISAKFCHHLDKMSLGFRVVYVGYLYIHAAWGVFPLYYLSLSLFFVFF